MKLRNIPLEQPSDATLKYWQLRQSPFAADGGVEQPARWSDFFFASDSLKHLSQNLAKSIENPNPQLLAIDAPPGSGVSTWARHQCATGGIGQIPLEMLTTSATHEPTTNVIQRLQARSPASQDVRRVWYIQTDQSSLRRKLQRWLEQSFDQSTGLTIILRHQFAIAPITSKSHSPCRLFVVSPPSRSELSAALTASWRHAGGADGVISAEAQERLASLAGRRFGRLAALCHSVLTWGHRNGHRTIDAGLIKWYESASQSSIDAWKKRAA